MTEVRDQEALEKARQHIGADMELHCANCGHHHCKKCRVCHRCGCKNYKKGVK